MNAMRHYTKLFVLAALGVAAASCGDVATNGRAPVYLVMDLLTDDSGSTVLQSDVAADNGSIDSDMGSVTLRLAQKDVIAQNSVGPSSNNQVTVRRYHVGYRRADGRNVPGVDVPYAFYGAATGTVPLSGSLKLGFELVRHVAKAESPLVQLANASVRTPVITTIADVTFYGEDLVGNEVQVSGSIQIDFGDFADSK